MKTWIENTIFKTNNSWTQNKSPVENQFAIAQNKTYSVLWIPASTKTRVHWSLLSFPSDSFVTAFRNCFFISSFFLSSFFLLFIKNQLILFTVLNVSCKKSPPKFSELLCLLCGCCGCGEPGCPPGVMTLYWHPSEGGAASPRPQLLPRSRLLNHSQAKNPLTKHACCYSPANLLLQNNFCRSTLTIQRTVLWNGLADQVKCHWC